MPVEWIWINGRVIPLADAAIGVEDRGFQFADGVYEVMRLYHGHPFTLAEHLDRLSRSAAAIELALPLPLAELALEIRRLIARTTINDGMVYLQLTRGQSPRNHVIATEIASTLLFYVRPLPVLAPPGQAPPVKLMSLPDERWKRCWIKTIALLPNTLAKSHAARNGFDEAVFIEDGRVTECSASNLFGVIRQTLVTHPVGPKVLPGITRAILLTCAAELGIPVQERAMTEAEAMGTDELFITSTTREVSWVNQWNAQPVGGAQCGPITLALHQALAAKVAREIPRAAARASA